MNACPELEVIAAYLDGRLTGRERAVVAEHLAECESCYFIFAEAAQMRASETTRQTTTDTTDAELPVPAAAPKWWTTPKIVWSSAASLAVAASLLLAIGTGIIPWRSGDSPELRALVVAVGTDRTIEARLTGGFAFGPVRAPVRSAEPSGVTISPDVRIAVARIEKEALAHRTPQTLRELGIAYLVSNDIERAIAALEEAADQSKTDGRTLNDLSAAYLTRAIQTGERQDFMRALTTAERALGSNSRLAEAWFNRAQALERLSLEVEAREAWQEYLKIDSGSTWASEARSHLNALERQ